MSTNRSIFEEVDGSKSEALRPTPRPKGSGDDGTRKSVSRWLFLLFVLVVVMILVGGLTRLTDSGLSITEWRPVTGAMPPLSAEAWDSEFDKYKAIPEFQLQNRDMTMSEFKYIYWWEWGHRQLGRVIGLVWAVGFLWFVFAKKIPRGWTGRLLVPGILGGIQGAIGWWMVSSGLTGTMVDVASYRLALHLGLAFVILGVLMWFIFLLGRSEMDLFQARRRKETDLMLPVNILTGLVLLQILLGALVAGLDAGRGYTDWPLMGGEILPSESFNISPFWKNLFENEALTQFNHRLAGYILLAYAGWLFWKSQSSGLNAIRNQFKWVLIFLVAQAVWGIITVMYGAPLNLAIVHQLGAILVWIIVLRARFEVVYPGVQRLK